MNERNLSIVRIVVECDRALSAALRVYNDPSCAMFSKGGKGGAQTMWPVYYRLCDGMFCVSAIG